MIVHNLPVASREMAPGVVAREGGTFRGVDYCKPTHFQGNTIISTIGRTGTRGRCLQVLPAPLANPQPSSEVFTPPSPRVVPNNGTYTKDKRDVLRLFARICTMGEFFRVVLVKSFLYFHLGLCRVVSSLLHRTS